MAKVEHFEDLEVWQLGREICREVEYLFLNTSLGKRYILRDQMDQDLLWIILPKDLVGEEIWNSVTFLDIPEDPVLN